jgi:hypothetical protein
MLERAQTILKKKLLLLFCISVNELSIKILSMLSFGNVSLFLTGERKPQIFKNEMF